MPNTKLFNESDLAELAKAVRMKSGRTKADLARELRVARSSIQLAEEDPEQSLTKLRIRIIEACSAYKVSGPGYWLTPK